MLHKLKIDPVYLEAKKQGLKMFEIRDNNDRGFQKGDTVDYRPYKNGCYQDKEGDKPFSTIILYVTNYMQKDGYVVFGDVKI